MRSEGGVGIRSQVGMGGDSGPVGPLGIHVARGQKLDSALCQIVSQKRCFIIESFFWWFLAVLIQRFPLYYIQYFLMIQVALEPNEYFS